MGCLVKILVVVAIIVVIGFVYVTCSGTQGCGCVKSIDKTLPDTAKAPYSVTTVTHLYYAATAVQNQDGSVTMQSWYERLNGAWVYRDSLETIPAALKPNIKRR